MHQGLTFRDFVERYGVTVGIVAVVALVLALLPGNAPDASSAREFSDLSDATGSIGDPADGGLSEFEAGGDGTVAGGGLTGGSRGRTGNTGSAGRVVTGTGGGGAQVLLGEGPCRTDGRRAGVSRYMPPCLRFVGDNGGATSRGVAGDKIRVVRYIGPLDPGTQAILESGKLADSPQKQRASYGALLRYYNQHYETYGREVELIEYRASGALEDDEAMKRDALRIAQEIKAFAVIVGTPEAPIPNVLASELAQRGVICICTVSLTSSFYERHPAYIFSSLPTITEYSRHVAEYIGKRLAGKNAVWAGDEFNPTQGYRNTQRKFGLIYLEGARQKVDPEGKRARDELVAELARYNVPLKTIGYIYDPGRNQQDVTNVIAQLKADGITTVIPYVDPLYPILFTQEATRQQYYPEWFIAGTGLSDTTTAGRLYDQNQWRHAFGISPLWITWATVANSAGAREYKHGGGDPAQMGVLINIYRAYFQSLFHGIHMAGPRLTPDSFAQGMFNYPSTGGLPALPLVFRTRSFPTEIKDFTEIWYDVDRRGPDERGEDGFGMIMKANEGDRYRPGQWPTRDADAFSDEGAVAVSDNPKGGGDPPHEQDGHTH